MFNSLGLSGNDSRTVDWRMVTTALELPGYRIIRSLGTVGASLQTIVGGDITLFTELCETARRDAHSRMMRDAAADGANAIVCARYDANELAPGVTEVLAYGTAVVVERVSPQ